MKNEKNLENVYNILNLIDPLIRELETAGIVMCIIESGNNVRGLSAIIDRENEIFTFQQKNEILIKVMKQYIKEIKEIKEKEDNI